MRTTSITCPEHEGCVAALTLDSPLPSGMSPRTLSPPDWARPWLAKQDGLELAEIRHETAKVKRDDLLVGYPDIAPSGMKILDAMVVEMRSQGQQLEELRSLLAELAEANRRVRKTRRKAAK